MSIDLGGSLFGIDATVDLVAEVEDEVLYMSADFFEQLGVPVDTQWIKIDRAAAEQAGEDTSLFDQLDITNPLDTASIFDDADNVEDRGDDEIDGEAVRHYVVTVQMSELLKVDESLLQKAEDLGADLPETVDYDVYVTEDNTIRRMRYDLDLDVGKVKVEVTFREPDGPLSIEVPASGDVTDVLDLL
jgi:hypothetical protein